MKINILLLVALLSVVLANTLHHVHRHHENLGKVYLERASKHHNLYLKYEENAKRYSALSRKYHAEAVHDGKLSEDYKLHGKRFKRSERKHQGLAEKLNREIAVDVRKSLRQDRRYKHFAALAKFYEKKALDARERARAHLAKYNRLVALIRELRGERATQIKERDQAKIEARHEFELARKYAAKERTADNESKNYAKEAMEALKKARKNKRLNRKYLRLHKRMVYLYNARSFRRRFRFFESKRKLYQKEGRKNLRVARKLASESRVHHNKYLRNVNAIKRLKAKIELYRREIAELERKIQNANGKIRKHTAAANHNERVSHTLHEKSTEHTSAARRFANLATQAQKDANSNLSKFRYWNQRYQSTFRHKKLHRGLHKRLHRGHGLKRHL